MSDPENFLERLLEEPGPSGFEARPARVWRGEAKGFAHKVWSDVHGNSFAEVGAERRPRVMLAGHMDEIGFQITHVDEEGFVYIDGIGGWDPQVVVGQRVRVMGRLGDVPGVVGKKPIHLLTPDDRKKVTKISDLWVDLGAASADAVTQLGVRVGDPIVLSPGFLRLAGDRIASRAIDNRVGAYVVLEALRLLAADPAPHAGAVAVGTVQEEIGYSGGGARSSAFALNPEVALVVDVTFSTDVPDANKKELGEHAIGAGPVLSRGSSMHPFVFDRLTEVADREEIPYSIQAAPRASRTDADGIFLVRSGVPTGLISIPNRYMHSPNEIVSVEDLLRAARLLAGFVRSLEEENQFVQE